MVTWEGDFNWQAYALQGRPDVLNYLHRGDVTWETLWSFYRARTAPPEAMLAVMNLFHAFMSAEYDRQGCWLDPDGELYRHTRAWAEFAVEIEGRLPEARIQSGLSHLADTSLISAAYYHAAFCVYMEALLDRHAAQWQRASALAPSSALLDFPDPESRLLPVYYPEASRFAELDQDPRWEASVRTLLAGRYPSWNQAYTAAVLDDDVEEATRDEGGEG